MALPGVLCLEGEWTDNLRNNQSVLPTLEHLKRLEQIDYIHRDVATREELAYYARLFARRAGREYANFTTIYLPMHGSPGALSLNSAETMTLAETAEQLCGAARGRFVYLGACSSLRAASKVRAFLDSSGASGICGFTKDVDWLESSAVDLLLLPALAHQGKRNGAESRMNSGALKPLTTRLGLKFVYA